MCSGTDLPHSNLLREHSEVPLYCVHRVLATEVP
jgi:hypothetical protein